MLEAPPLDPCAREVPCPEGLDTRLRTWERAKAGDAGCAAPVTIQRFNAIQKVNVQFRDTPKPRVQSSLLIPAPEIGSQGFPWSQKAQTLECILTNGLRYAKERCDEKIGFLLPVVPELHWAID